MSYRILYAIGLFVSGTAAAQLGPYQTTTTGSIGSSTPCGGTGLIRTISVGEDIIISDLDVGLLASHTYRSDINMRLTSPQGTVSNILTGPYTIGSNNYNIRMDDSAGNLVDTSPHTSNDSITAVPPYQNTVRPESPLSVFNGENANGTWTMRFCDVYTGADNGTFRQANLFFTPEPAVLAASKTVEIWDPAAAGLYALPGNEVIYTVSITNTGDGFTDPASVFFVDTFPDDVEFYNGDIDDGGPQTNPVAFIDSGSGLSFSYASHVRYSNLTAKPANFAACSYTPTTGYDPAVKHVCIQPAGQMDFDPGTPGFSVQFRARIK